MDVKELYQKCGPDELPLAGAARRGSQSDVLEQRDRRALRVHLGANVRQSLGVLYKAIEPALA